MPDSRAIIGCVRTNVNGLVGVSRKTMLVLMIGVAALVGCDERHAAKLEARAEQQVKSGDLEAATATLERIVKEYPQTAAARRAKEQITLYRGLNAAVQSFPQRESRDRMVSTARAILRYRQSSRSWPDSLDQLVPNYLRELPIDSWGRPLDYRAKAGGRGFVLACLGADGERGGSEDDADLVVVDGSFVRQLPADWR